MFVITLNKYQINIYICNVFVDDPSSSSNDRPDIENPSHQGNKQEVQNKPPRANKQPGNYVSILNKNYETFSIY